MRVLSLSSTFARVIQGKESRFRRRRVRDGVELGVMRAKRLRDFDLGAFEDADELQPVDDCFALEMIVGDNKRVARVLGDSTYPRDPRRKFFRGVKIVVAFVRGDGRVVAE